LTGALEWLATLSNLGYLLLAIRGKAFAWVLGAMGAFFSIFLFLHPDIRLYSDALLQVVYFALAVYGFFQWHNQRTRDRSFKVRRIKGRTWVVGFLLAALFSLLLGNAMVKIGADFAMWDAFTTGFSILATLWTARRYLENWLLWIAIDFFCIFLYLQKGLFLFAFLFGVYCLLAVVGYRNWKNKIAII
jgi:nicotinamide mononucleotide transporter